MFSVLSHKLRGALKKRDSLNGDRLFGSESWDEESGDSPEENDTTRNSHINPNFRFETESVNLPDASPAGAARCSEMQSLIPQKTKPPLHSKNCHARPRKPFKLPRPNMPPPPPPCGSHSSAKWILKLRSTREQELEDALRTKRETVSPAASSSATQVSSIAVQATMHRKVSPIKREIIKESRVKPCDRPTPPARPPPPLTSSKDKQTSSVQENATCHPTNATLSEPTVPPPRPVPQSPATDPPPPPETEQQQHEIPGDRDQACSGEAAAALQNTIPEPDRTSVTSSTTSENPDAADIVTLRSGKCMIRQVRKTPAKTPRKNNQTELDDRKPKSTPKTKQYDGEASDEDEDEV